MLKIYLIAGEASGDNIGAKLMKALRHEKRDIEFHGIGGEKMKAAGLKSLFPMHELSIMGFFEIITHLPKLWLRKNQTIADIKRIKPDMLITIDSPGFCFRIAKALKGQTKLVHYVAPTVWAYKPKRAKKIAKIYDHLLAILPFEPPYFLKEGLSTTFVGYPALEDLHVSAKDFFRHKYNIAKGDMLLCLAPGSREQEVKRLLPIFLDAAELFIKHSNQRVVIAIPCQKHLIPLIKQQQRENLNIILVDEENKSALFSSIDLALTKSGTITTELAFYDVPMVVAHKVNIITNWLIRRMLKVKYATIINLLADKEIIPELIQEKCNAKNIAKHLLFLTEISNRQQQLAGINENISKLYVGGTKSSEAAAKDILSLF